MAACSDTEEKPSSPKDTLPLKITSENAVNHEMRKNCYNEINNVSKNHETFSEITEKSNPDVNTLSEDEFLQLMIEASTFNKSSKQESALLKKLRIDNPITETEPSDKAKLGTNSQFPVHKNTRNYTGHHSFPSGASHSRTLDGRKKHSRNKDDSHAKSTLNANALQKGIHQSQSLQDLMSSDLTKSKQKSHKAHRTHSLSSDEVTGIDPESLTILKKLGKKSSYKQSSSSKSETNKTNTNKASVDADGALSGLRDGLPNHCSVNEVNVPTARRDSVGESNSLPIEIEMEEFKSDKMSGQEDSASTGKEIEKSRSGVAHGNSKFYVDCNDVDSTVSFPLKLVSSIDDQNNDVGDQLKRFPIVPWPRPLQVQSFFSSLPIDSDSFSGSDKQILNADINGNPFTRNTRPSNLASFVSSTLMDYSNNGIVSSEQKNRKNKRLRNSGNKGVLAENIAGHRGEEDIDSLLQFINSSDKKAKSAVKGNSQNQIISAKSNLLHDNERKKSLGKEVKNCHKNVINVAKKDRLKRSSSLENISSNKVSNDVSDVFLFEPRGSESDLPVKDSKPVPSDTSTGKNLDINSNEENKLTQVNEKGRESSTSESSLHNDGAYSSPEVSSFAADFYSTADVSSQTIEEPGFLIVKKKQRKKHQGKRSESYRWRNAQAQRKKGIMLPLAESKCGKQDSRRKSTSSVPHSDHSSADNSDLDSVHSLPVRGSVPHPTQPHPHTTPSSSSSTPQASYADIARMPISKLNSPSPSIIGTQACVKSPSSVEHEVKRLDSISSSGMSSAKDSIAGSSLPPAKESAAEITTPSVRDTPLPVTTSSPKESVSGSVMPSAKESVGLGMPLAKENAGSVTHLSKRKVTDSKVCSVSKEPFSTLVENESDSTSDVKVRSHAKSTREINTQTEPENLLVPAEIKVESSAAKHKKIEESSKNLCSACSSRKNNCSCSKPHPGMRQKTKSVDIPPVIMDNMPPESNPCNVSFGFGIEEVLQMDSAENTSSFDLQKDNRETSNIKKAQCKSGEIVVKSDGISEISSVNSKTNVGSFSKSSLTLEVASRPLPSQDLAHEQSSHLQKVSYGAGINICYKETKVNVKRFNHSELIRFLGYEFQNVEKEVKGISKNSKASSKVEYYTDSS